MISRDGFIQAVLLFNTEFSGILIFIELWRREIEIIFSGLFYTNGI